MNTLEPPTTDDITKWTYELEQMTTEDMNRWTNQLEQQRAANEHNQYELMMWWKIVAKANNIQWIETQNERDLRNANAPTTGALSIHYLEAKYGKVDPYSSSSHSSSDKM